MAAPATRSGKFRLLTVTNSHDLERYGTHLVLEAYWAWPFQRREGGPEFGLLFSPGW